MVARYGERVTGEGERERERERASMSEWVSE